MFSQIFSIVILCMSLNHNKSPLQVKTPSFDTYNVNTPTEPEKIIPLLKKPELNLKSNTINNYTIRIYNPNETWVHAYINNNVDAIFISRDDAEEITYNWEENQTTIDILIYFKDPNGKTTDTSILTVNRPQIKLQAPTYEIVKNDYEEYKIKFTNPNNTNAILYCETEQDLHEQEIAANDWIAFTEGWDGMGNDTTITAYLYKNGGAYTNSDTITINLTRPSAPNYLSGGYGTYNYIPNTHKYEITIKNTNPVAVNYTDNFSNNFTIQENTTTKISIQLTPTQEDLTINGTFKPTGGNYQTTNFDLKINNIHYIDITSISRQKNGNITIKYKDAQPINTKKWSIDITDGAKYTDSINLNIQNTEGTLTIENQPNSKLYLTTFYNSTIVKKETIEEIKTEQEIVDIPSIMLLILTLPFSFLSQAFNLTLFAGTQYAFNAADIILTIVGAIIIFYIIKLIIKIIKLF